MMSKRKLIFFELNEVPFRVIDDYHQRHPNSFFTRHYSRLCQYETYADASRPLEPCFNWPSVHRGVPDKVHQVYDWNMNLSDVDAEFPPVWKILARTGIRVGLFGSMHSHGSYPSRDDLDKGYEYYIPDVFSPDPKCYPHQLESFQKVCLGMIRSSARNVSTRIGIEDCLTILRQLGGLGLRQETIRDIGKQLVKEKLAPWMKTRRRTHHVTLAFDVFMKLLRQTKPDFTTFFANNLAAAMHRYWAAAFPQDYPQYEMTQEWRETYRDEIDWAMTKFDGYYRRLVDFVDANPEYRLVIASGMGQAATVARHLYSEVYITNLEKFMSKMGVEPDGWTFVPAMFPWFNIRVSESWIEPFKASLKVLKIAGEPVLYNQHEDGLFALFLGHQDLDHSHAYLRDERIEFGELGLFNVRNEDLAQRTGYHIPEGSLLVYDPQRKPDSSQQLRERFSSLDIAPSLLQAFGVAPPSYMTDRVIEGIV